MREVVFPVLGIQDAVHVRFSFPGSEAESQQGGVTSVIRTGGRAGNVVD